MWVWRVASAQDLIDNYDSDYISALTHYSCRSESNYEFHAFLFPAPIDIIGRQKQIMIDSYRKGFGYSQYRKRVIDDADLVEEEKLIERYKQSGEIGGMWVYVFIRRRVGDENLKIFDVEVKGPCFPGEASLVAQKGGE